LELELEIVSHIELLESTLFGLKCHEVRKMEFELEERNGMCRRFDKNTKMAGWEWLRGLKSRHAEIAFR
jgi:hypothetical protein